MLLQSMLDRSCLECLRLQSELSYKTWTRRYTCKILYLGFINIIELCFFFLIICLWKCRNPNLTPILACKQTYIPNISWLQFCFWSMGISPDNVHGLVLAVSSSVFIGSSFIVKKKGLLKSGNNGTRAGLFLLPD